MEEFGFDNNTGRLVRTQTDENAKRYQSTVEKVEQIKGVKDFKIKFTLTVL